MDCQTQFLRQSGIFVSEPLRPSGINYALFCNIQLICGHYGIIDLFSISSHQFRMANSLSQLRAPTIPDYYLCDAAYGEEILTTDCSLALSNFHSQYPLGVYHSSDFPLEASAGMWSLIRLYLPGSTTYKSYSRHLLLDR